MQNAIIQRGFITTRVVVRPHNLGSGVLVLTIIPGRISQITLSPNSDSRANYWNALPAERECYLPDSSGKRPWGQRGESDVIINWQQKRPLRIFASFDDGGSKQTGKYQGSPTIFWDQLFGLNDLFYLNLRRDCGGSYPGPHGTKGHSLHYSLPYGYWCQQQLKSDRVPCKGTFFQWVQTPPGNFRSSR